LTFVPNLPEIICACSSTNKKTSCSQREKPRKHFPLLSFLLLFPLQKLLSIALSLSLSLSLSFLPGLTKLVSKLSKEGSWRKALEVFETVEETGLRPDTALTNSAISACDKGGRWQRALEIFDSMEHRGLPRDAITYSATISALAKGKQWHTALRVFDHMQGAGVVADVVTCCSLINALERGGQWQLAERLFLEMCTVQREEERAAGEQKRKERREDDGATPPRAPGRPARTGPSPTSVLLALGSPGAGLEAGTMAQDRLVSKKEGAKEVPECSTISFPRLTFGAAFTPIALVELLFPPPSLVPPINIARH
jgi:pentatricopeptide repeat protein